MAKGRGKGKEQGKEITIEIEPQITLEKVKECPAKKEELQLPDWLNAVPLRLRQRLLWQKSTMVDIVDGVIILLYVGKKDEGALDQLITAQAPETGKRVYAIDYVREVREHDMLLDEPYFSICTAACQGKVPYVGGGPMCRTWSIRRHFPRKGGGLPLRGYASPLPPLLGLTVSERKKGKCPIMRSKRCTIEK